MAHRLNPDELRCMLSVCLSAVSADDNGALAVALLCFDPNVAEQPCTS